MKVKRVHRSDPLQCWICFSQICGPDYHFISVPISQEEFDHYLLCDPCFIQMQSELNGVNGNQTPRAN